MVTDNFQASQAIYQDTNKPQNS